MDRNAADRQAVHIGLDASPGKHGRHTGRLSHITGCLLSLESLISVLILTRRLTLQWPRRFKTHYCQFVATSMAIIGLLSFATSSLFSSVPTQPVSTAFLPHRHP